MPAGYVPSCHRPDLRWHRYALLQALAGCTGDPGCTLVGCVSQAVVQLPAGTSSGEVCVAGVCATTVVDGELRVPLGRRADGSTAVVTVTLPGRSLSEVSVHEGEVPLTRTRPNGERCPPVCVDGAARVDVASGQVLSVDPPSPAAS